MRAKLCFLESGNALLPFTSFKAADIKLFFFFFFSAPHYEITFFQFEALTQQ